MLHCRKMWEVRNHDCWYYGRLVDANIDRKRILYSISSTNCCNIDIHRISSKSSSSYLSRPTICKWSKSYEKDNGVFNCELDEEGMNDFGKYKNSIGIFNSCRLKNYTDGQTFWQAIVPVHPKLSSFAIKILQLSCCTKIKILSQ